MSKIDALSAQEISERLLVSTAPTHDIPVDYLSADYRQAGVLMPLLREANAWHLLFIRRAVFEQDKHSGQVAFAGGKYEESDSSLIATALRETHEEIGINPDDVTILGQLGHHHTISNFCVVPTVGTIPWPYHLVLDSREVAHTFTIPLNWLTEAANHEIRYRQLAEHKNPVPVVYFKEYQGELLWGATARMVLSLVKRLK